MRKALRISGIVVAVLLGLAVLVLTAVPLVLNSKVVTNLVDKYAAEYIDGDLEYARIRIFPYRDLPLVGITLEDVALTYPHERFSAYDTAPVSSDLLEAGRGVSKDTLARFGTLAVQADAWKLAHGEIVVHKVALSRFSAFAHDYGETANWSIIRLPASDTTHALDLPWIALRELRIDEQPRLVYTAQRKGLYADARFQRLALEGRARLSSKEVLLDAVHLALDSLQLSGKTPGDSLAAGLGRLRLDEQKDRSFRLALAADALWQSAKYGEMVLPLRLDSDLRVDWQPGRTGIDIPRLEARIAQVPLEAAGQAVLTPGRTDLDAGARITDCPLDSLQRGYLDHFMKISRDIKTSARVNLDLDAKGSWTRTSKPAVTAHLTFPSAQTLYRPQRIGGPLTFELDAEMSPSGKVDARIRRLRARISGAKIQGSGTVRDLLGRNPHYQVQARADGDMQQMKSYLPASLGVEEAAGDFHLDLQANVTKAELQTYRFQKADVSGLVTSDSLRFSLPADSIYAKLYKTRIQVGSNEAGIRLNADFDSLYANKGVSLQARVREMRNGAQVIKVPVEGQMVPKLFASTDNGEIFAKVGSSRMGVRGSSVWLSAEKRLRRQPAGRRRPMEARPRGDFADSDLSITLDSTWSNLLREWSPSGSLYAENGFLATPRLPLRTRITALSADFNDNEIDIDSLGIVSGSSDVTAAGYMQGIRQALFRHGVLEAQLNVESRRLNINEFIAALQAGSADIGEVDPGDEQDESFVTDTLEDARIAQDKKSLIIVPGNIKATVGIQADTVDYAELQVGPVLSVARVQDRTAQLLGTHVISDIGRIGLDAFYSTWSKDDILAGVNLRLADMKAHDIIQLLPSVDSLMPAIKSFDGRLGCNLGATAKLDTNMNVIIPSLDGLLRITGKDLEVKDAGDLKRITRLLLFRNKDIGHIDDLSVDAVVHDSKLEVFPFELGVDRYKLALRGTQGFDRSLYYHISILRSPFLLRFGINLFGSLDNWKFSLGRAEYREGRVPVYTKQLDSVQVNIAQGVRDIFDSGVRRVQRFNTGQRPAAPAAGGDLLDAEDYRQIDDMILAAALEEQEEEMYAEIDDALASATQATDDLLKEYAEQTYDKRILRKMEKMNNKK